VLVLLQPGLKKVLIVKQSQFYQCVLLIKLL
jgi:hypothetical protein